MPRLPHVLSMLSVAVLMAGGFAVATVPPEPETLSPQPAMQRTAPEFCRIEFAGVSGFLASCVRSHASQLSSLPSSCMVQLRDGDQTRQVYDRACMEADGWASR